MKINDRLATFGLSKPEITVYLHLLEHGLSSPPQIIKGTKLLRANVYNILTALEQKNLIDTQAKGKRKLYFSKDPEALEQNLERQRSTLKTLVPDLRALYKEQKNKPTIKFLYGLEEIRDLFTETYGKGKIQYILSTNILFETYPTAFLKYRKSLVKRGVFVEDILTQASATAIAEKTKEAMGGYYDYRLFEQKYEDMPTSIRIWDDNIALISFDEPAFGTVIKNQALATTFKVMFETMWSVGKK